MNTAKKIGAPAWIAFGKPQIDQADSRLLQAAIDQDLDESEIKLLFEMYKQIKKSR